MSMHRVLVCGGRDYNDADRIKMVLDHYRTESGGFAVVIHGCASGVDSLAGLWAETRGIPEEKYPAAWTDLKTQPVVTRYRRDGTAYNALAGHIRNTRMLVEGKPTVVIAFPGGSGTADMVRRAHMAKVPVLQVPA